MVFCIFFTVNGERLWDMISHVGNKYDRWFMSPATNIHVGNVIVCENTVAVVLDNNMTAEERRTVQQLLLDALLFVVDVAEDCLAILEAGSETRMASFLLGSTFVPPSSNQRHLLKPLCDHAGLTLDKVAGTCSVVGAVMALQYALACGLVAIGVI
jgi:hypothetical protein